MVGCLSVALSQANEDPLATVKVGQTATFRLSTVDMQRLETRASGTARLIVTVVGYTPPRDGAVQIVVALNCAGTERELGRLGIFPSTAFTPSDVRKAQLFGLPVPDDPACRAATSASVRLMPTLGRGEGAAITIGRVTIDGQPP
jgi:hypothetical protein